MNRYASHLFVTAYSVALDTTTGQLGVNEIDAFVTTNALVTVRKSTHFDIDAVIKHWDQSPDLAVHGTSFLLYGLLDYVVNTHFEAVQSLDTEVEGLEDGLFEENPQDRHMQIRTFQLRKSLVTLRRVVLPMREVVNSLLRRDLHASTLRWCPTSRTCTTTFCGPRSGRSRCATWSPRSWRRTSPSAETGST